MLTGKYQSGTGARDVRRFRGSFRSGNLARAMPVVEALTEIGEAHGGKTSAQVALNWLARQDGVLPIPGAKNEDQARQNAASINWELSDEEAAGLDRVSTLFRR